MKFRASQYNILVHEVERKVYLYNSFSGSFCSLNQSVYEEIQTGYSESSPYFNMLLSEGYIVPEPLDEFGRFLLRQKDYFFGNKESIRFVIAPSLACNLNCIYCFEHGANDNRSSLSTMSQSILERTLSFILERIKENPYVKKVCIDWFGGEPLLQIKKIVWLSERLIDYCEKNGIDYYSFIITNGLLLSRDVADILSSQCGIKRIQLTVDGDSQFYQSYKHADVDSLEKLIRHMEYASQLFKIDVRMNTSKENRQEIIDTAKAIMENKGISNNLTVYPAQIADCNMGNCHSLSDCEFEDFRVLFESELKPYRLENGSKNIKIARRISFCSSMKRNHYVIGPDGSIYKCEHEIGRPNEVIGNVLYGLYCNEAEYKYYDSPVDCKCRSCAFFPFCFGGCPSARIIYNKRVDCETVRRRIITKLCKELLSKYMSNP